jgi:tRNA-Thr(GGU) m(6)t(6)A37 methyltransferase TsaA
MDSEIIYQPIGHIKTPFDTVSDMPIQPCGASGAQGIIELDSGLTPGLFDLEGFSHLILIYHFHLVKGYKLYVVPFMDDQPHGIFATRAPTRPNAIGISIVELLKIEGNLIHISGVDMVNGTPLLDIKPFFTKYDNRLDAKAGWLEGKGDIDITKIKSDNRFESIKKSGTQSLQMIKNSGLLKFNKILTLKSTKNEKGLRICDPWIAFFAQFFRKLWANYY